MKPKIFVLEDDAAISGLIKLALEMHGSDVETFDKISDFIAAFAYGAPSVALIDIMLPDGNGLDALRQIKQKYPEQHCIIISALGKEEDKVKGLELGADDYVVKPFSVVELSARVDAQLRRAVKSARIDVGELSIDVDAHKVILKGNELELNNKEFELLSYLARNAGKALRRERILIDVWGYEQGETRTLDNHIARLRKLGISVETVFGVGYRLAL